MKVKITRYPKKNIDRKIDITIHDDDIFSFDHTMAFIILPALLAIKENKMGIPGEFAEVGGEDYGIQTCFDFYRETHNEAFDLKVKEWETILNKIIWSFQELASGDYEDNYYYGEAKYETVELEETMNNPITQQQEGLYSMVDTNPEEHWLDINGLLLHKERIQEGLELFGKYYQNLWT